MNLDEQMRAALNLEAEMRTAPTPDTDSMIAGGRARRRRRNTQLLGSGLLAVVLLGGGIYGATQIGSAEPDVDNAPASDPPAEDPQAPYWPGEGVEASGTYRMQVQGQIAAETMDAQVTIEGSNWEGDYPVATRSGSYAGMAAYRVTNLADGSGCYGEDVRPVATESAHEIARMLAAAPRSTIVMPIERTSAFGHDGFHVRIRIDPDCEGGRGLKAIYWVGRTTGMHHNDGSDGVRGITYYDGAKAPDLIVDFWVVDVDGVPVVVDMFRDVDAPDDLVVQVGRAVDSVTFVPSESD